MVSNNWGFLYNFVSPHPEGRLPGLISLFPGRYFPPVPLSSGSLAAGLFRELLSFIKCIAFLRILVYLHITHSLVMEELVDELVHVTKDKVAVPFLLPNFSECILTILIHPANT